MSVGIAVYARDGLSFEELYKCADAAPYCTKSDGKDGYSFYQKGMSNDYVLTNIDSGTEPAAPQCRTVLAVTDLTDAFTELAGMLEPEYETLHVDAMTKLAELLGNGHTICAVILDTDTFTGWYADETLTEPVTEVTLKKNTTVYAGW